MTFKIEKNHPLPPHRSKNESYPFRSMKIGDSFEYSFEHIGRMRSAASWFSKRNPPYRFTLRKMNDKTYRIWRIE